MARISPGPAQQPGLGEHRAAEHIAEELRRCYRAAGRPSLREVSRAVEGRADLKEVTASQETVRRMLSGMTLPTDWDRVYAIFFILCEMGSIDPEQDRWEGDTCSGPETSTQYLKRLRDTALDADPNPPPIPRPAVPQQAPRGFGQDDPWPTAKSGFSDEPPFFSYWVSMARKRWLPRLPRPVHSATMTRAERTVADSRRSANGPRSSRTAADVQRLGI